MSPPTMFILNKPIFKQIQNKNIVYLIYKLKLDIINLIIENNKLNYFNRVILDIIFIKFNGHSS